MMPTSVDIVIPTVRLDPRRLIPILELETPPGMQVHFYLVIDRPGIQLDPVLAARTSRTDVTILRNAVNMGAHMSRNKGLEAGTGEFILFLDDDVEPDSGLLHAYARAIEGDPEAPGFVGTTRFPPPVNAFTRGVVASDILTFFDYGETEREVAWGVTANLVVRRTALGYIRFSPRFPKWGGGEDIDLCLRVVSASGRWFRAVADAVVIHPWWDGGHRQYRRFARWAYGDSQLPRLHPQHRFRNAPNMAETAILSTVLLIPAIVARSVAPWSVVLWMSGIVPLECVAEAVRMRLRGKEVTLRIAAEATLVRLANDFGRIRGNLGRLHIGGFTERFDYFATRKHIRYERIVATTKLALYVLTAFVLLAL